jgi:DNA-binding LytR/AlgR family response regulator
MKVLLIEDEKPAANNLEQMLLQIDRTIEILGKIDSVEESVKWLSNNSADLIFLDIHLADGICFKIFEKVKIQTPIIFTTAYDQYAIKAFQVNSIDYLLKPIEIEQLEQSLNKFKDLILLNNSKSIDIDALIKHFNNKPAYQERFMVHYAHKIKSINTDDIAYFYVRSESVYLCTKHNKHYAIDYTLDRLETVINPKIFYRVNRQYMINISCIQNMYSMSKSRIKIELNPKPDEDVMVSYGRVGEFRKWLNE